MSDQLAAAPTTFPQLLERINTYLFNPLIGLIFAVALAYFLWGVFVFIQNSDNDEQRKQGQQHMLWGVVGMFIMVAVYGILNVITGTFGLPRV